ncbi:MAG: hypothetical protein J6U54_09900 [Clostridiales bacterium]|nr:hypothetical protein [Clostridiales bacterium]
MSGLTADADIDESLDLFGYTVDDLQSDVEVDGTSVSGILNYIDDYTSAGYTDEEAEGNFLVLHFSVPDVEDAEIQITTNGRTKTLDEDGILIARVADKDSQTITVVASKDGYDDVTKVYDLSGLIVEDGEDDNPLDNNG